MQKLSGDNFYKKLCYFYKHNHFIFYMKLKIVNTITIAAGIRFYCNYVQKLI